VSCELGVVGCGLEAFGVDGRIGREGAHGFGEEGAELGHGLGMGWLAGEVGQFARVGGVIVKFAAFLSAIPFNVAVALGGDGAAHDLGEVVERGGQGAGIAGEAEDLGKGGAVPRGFRVFEQWFQTDAGEPGWRLEGCEIAQGGEEVDELDDTAAGFAALGFGDLGGGDDEGRSGGFVKEGAFLPEAVLAEMVAVVAPEHDEGFVPELVVVEGIEDKADLSINEGDAGVVGAKGFTEGVVGQSVAGGGAVVREGCGRDVGAIGGGRVRQAGGAEGIGIEPGFWRDEGGVGAKEADGEEEGLLAEGVLAEEAGGFEGDHAVGLFGIGAVGGEPAEGGADGFFGGGVDDEGFVGDVAALGVEDAVPGGRVIEAVGADAVGHVVVEDLADACGDSAAPPEQLGQGDGVGQGVAEMAVEVVNLGGVGAEASEDGGAGGIAKGELAVGAFEEEAAGVEAVEVGGGEAGGPGAAEDVAEVVDGDEEDVVGGFGFEVCQRGS
jgi:hypothetical protein